MTDPILPDEKMPTQMAKTIDLSVDQLSALFGDKPCTPGEKYTVTLTAGETDESGFQKFTAAPESEAAETPPGGGEMLSDMEDQDDSDSEKAMLGYDRRSLVARRKRQAPKMAATELED